MAWSSPLCDPNISHCPSTDSAVTHGLGWNYKHEKFKKKYLHRITFRKMTKKLNLIQIQQAGIDLKKMKSGVDIFFGGTKKIVMYASILNWIHINLFMINFYEIIRNNNILKTRKQSLNTISEAIGVPMRIQQKHKYIDFSNATFSTKTRSAECSDPLIDVRAFLTICGQRNAVTERHGFECPNAVAVRSSVLRPPTP